MEVLIALILKLKHNIRRMDGVQLKTYEIYFYILRILGICVLFKHSKPCSAAL